MKPMKRFVLLAVVGVAACAWLAGTAASRATDSSTLVVAATTAPDTLNPQQSALNQTWPYWQLSYECLMRTLPSGQVIPWLAKSYTVNPSGTVYTFTLRSGVKFQNGATMSASDVVYTFNLLHSSGIPYAQNRFPTLTGVTALSPSQVQFTLSGPQPGFLLNMGDPFTVACAILSQKAGPSNLSARWSGPGPSAWSRTPRTISSCSSGSTATGVRRPASPISPSRSCPTRQLSSSPSAPGEQG